VIRISSAGNATWLVADDTIASDMFFARAIGTFLSVDAVSSDVVIFVAAVTSYWHPNVLTNIDDFALHPYTFLKVEVSEIRRRAEYFEVCSLLARRAQDWLLTPNSGCYGVWRGAVVLFDISDV
jgi:hypothetical protein